MRQHAFLVAVSYALAITACERAPKTAQAPSAAPEAVSGSTPSIPWNPQAPDPGRYVDSVFRSQFGESPRIGWFLPDDQFLAPDTHPVLHLLASGSHLTEATFRRVITPAAHDSLTSRYGVGCENRWTLGLFDLGAAPLFQHTDRAFFISSPVPASVRAGVNADTLTAAERATAHAFLPVNNPGARYLDAAFAVEGSTLRFTTDAAYSSSTQVLIATALVLHDSLGRAIAHETRDTTWYECDGCEAPGPREGLERLWHVLNAFILPGFAYPVLLLETNGGEGSALSLVTFGPDGRYSEFRLYEYTVDCGGETD